MNNNVKKVESSILFMTIGVISILVGLSFAEDYTILTYFGSCLMVYVENSYNFSATRSLALLALGLRSTSSSLAVNPFSNTLKGVKILP